MRAEAQNSLSVRQFTLLGQWKKVIIRPLFKRISGAFLRPRFLVPLAIAVVSLGMLGIEEATRRTWPAGAGTAPACRAVAVPCSDFF
jgi:hypothetical protein